jgi:hypothetical protein
MNAQKKAVYVKPALVTHELLRDITQTKTGGPICLKCEQLPGATK